MGPASDTGEYGAHRGPLGWRARLQRQSLRPRWLPGSSLLEEAKVADIYLAPALAAIAYETDKPDTSGLDYAGLQIGHLGAIYEALLALRLTRAPEDLAYDAKQDVFRPARAGEQPEVTKAQFYYQAEAGEDGRPEVCTTRGMSL